MTSTIDVFAISKKDIEAQIKEIQDPKNDKIKNRLKVELNGLISTFNFMYPDFKGMYTPVILEEVNYYGNIKPDANGPERYNGGKSRRMKKSRRRMKKSPRRTKKSRRRVRIYL